MSWPHQMCLDQINKSNAISHLIWFKILPLCSLFLSLSLSSFVLCHVSFQFSIIEFSVYSCCGLDCSFLLPMSCCVCVFFVSLQWVCVHTNINLCACACIRACMCVWWLFMLHCWTPWLVLAAAQLPAVLVAGRWLKPIRLAMAPSRWPLTPPTPGLITCWLAHAGPPPVGTEG